MDKLKECPSCRRMFSGRSKYCRYQCAVEGMFDANNQIKTKDGPIYEKWKARWEAATGLKLKGGE